MILRANCKINIGLDVLRRREDGYHDLETVMLPVKGLYDEISLEPAAQFSFEQRGLMVDCPLEENICVKAYRLMQSRYAVPPVSLVLEKRVPFGAGLGGGSSDATMVLVGLNALFGLGLSTEELELRAAELGSDTAFFVQNRTQCCTGRGERMTPVELPLQGLWLLLVKPDEGVSTREAYAGVVPMVPPVSLIERLAQPLAQWQQCIKNDFEPSVFRAHPRLQEIKQQLLASGALYAAMSGSGSTLFALYKERPTDLTPFAGLFTHLEQIA